MSLVFAIVTVDLIRPSGGTRRAGEDSLRGGLLADTSGSTSSVPYPIRIFDYEMSTMRQGIDLVAYNQSRSTLSCECSSTSTGKVIEGLVG